MTNHEPVWVDIEDGTYYAFGIDSGKAYFASGDKTFVESNLESRGWVLNQDGTWTPKKD